MRVLALDTTTRAGSVAIVHDDAVVVERLGDTARSHAERLPTEILIALEASGLTWSDIDVFAIAVGPGSFTGLRIGIATIQGIAFVQRKPVVPISALTALAETVSDEPAGALVGAWMDAHRREIFSALFRVTDRPPFAADRLVELDPAKVGDPAVTLACWQEAGLTPVALAGDGAVLYANIIAGRVRVVAPPPLASIVGRMAVARARGGEAVDPAAVQPLYIRRPDVEITRDAQTLHHGGGGGTLHHGGRGGHGGSDGH